VAGRALALLATGLVVIVLAAVVVIPKLGGATAYTILTGSMRPGMPPGTLVVVKPVAPDQVRTGDVLTYQIKSGDPTVATHRVSAVGLTTNGEYRFTMKGDANDAADPALVRPEQIKGKRWYAVPDLAWPTLKVDADIREVVVIGAVGLLIGYSVMSFVGAARDRRRARRTTTDTDLAPFEPDRETQEVAS
jgi:signal peptidase